MDTLSLQPDGREVLTASPVHDALADQVRRQRTWLHDRTLQVLEYIAAGGYRPEPHVQELRRVAARAADELRAFIEDAVDEHGSELVRALRDLVAEERMRALYEIELVVGRTDGSVGGPGAAALVAAAGEALANARKHARARRVTVWCETDGGRAHVTVLDDGVGFDPERTPYRTGLKHSVATRMSDHGGSAHVESWPGEGTYVSLRLGPPAEQLP